MVRTQVLLAERQHERVRQMAHSNRVSFSEMVRRLLDVGLNTGQGTHVHATTSLLDLAGIGRSEEKDLGRNHDDYLDEDYLS
jgi:hypothetical protein